MKQPELGKKIAELRKAKGLTQEELVDKCNLSVRTLQRIESGEVTPRSYTIKTIFAALDYAPKINNRFSNSGFIVSNWLEQFYRYFIDLFNLKTNKMKKITILSIVFSSIIFGLFVLCIEIKAQKDDSHKQTEMNNSSNSSQNGFQGFGVITGKSFGFDTLSAKAIIRRQDEVIAKDVTLAINGVKICSKLIKIDMKSFEYVTVIFEGKISANSTNIKIPKYTFDNIPDIKYSADKIDKVGDKIILKGKAIINFANEIVEANEIIINLN